MKLALLGATGGVGREVLSQAVAAGHAVTAVVRNPAKLPVHVDVVRQDLGNPNNEVLAAALRDVDAVVSAVGPGGASQAGIVAPATAAITHAMDCAGVRRLVVISAAPVGVVPSTHRPHPPRYDPGDDLLMRNLLSPLIRRLFLIKMGVFGCGNPGEHAVLPGFRQLNRQGMMRHGNGVRDGQHAERHRQHDDQPDACRECASQHDRHLVAKISATGKAEYGSKAI